jgi:hypothetical protein
MVTVQLKATTSTEVGATTTQRIKALHPSHDSYHSQNDTPGSVPPPTTLTKYNGKTKPELWLADFRLACQLGGATDGRVII